MIFRHWAKSATASNARTVKRILKELIEQTGKEVPEATRADARQLVQFYTDRGLSLETIKGYMKKLSTLFRASADEVDFGTDTNVFQCLVKAEKVRMAITAEPPPKSMLDEDVRKLMAHVPNLSFKLQFMVMMVACCGLRPREVLTIQSETTIDDMRCFGLGTKGGKSAWRVLPFPEPVLKLPGFPKRITQPIFEDAPLGIGDYDALEKVADCYTSDIGKMLRSIGIPVRKGYGFYSLRHRAHTRLRVAEMHPNVERYIVGHALRKDKSDVKTFGSDIHESYGDHLFKKPRLAEAMRCIWRDL